MPWESKIHNSLFIQWWIWSCTSYESDIFNHAGDIVLHFEENKNHIFGVISISIYWNRQIILPVMFNINHWNILETQKFLYFYHLHFVFFSLLDVKCPAGQIYQECGNACQRTCKDLASVGSICTEACVAGCNCPPGQVLNDAGECITTDLCPCTSGANVYQPGDVFDAPKCQRWWVTKTLFPTLCIH